MEATNQPNAEYDLDEDSIFYAVFCLYSLNVRNFLSKKQSFVKIFFVLIFFQKFNLYKNKNSKMSQITE